MSLRFDKDTRRATNGPMIFFSDPSAEISLGEEIRGAINSRLSFYAYRRPGDMMISFGSSETVVEGIGVPGFVIAPFNPALPYLTIPYKPLPNKDSNAKDYSFSTAVSVTESTSKSGHAAEVNAIREAIDKQGYGKVVAARIIVEDKRVEPAATFSNLCREYPNAFVFCFSTPVTGCWVGASPELLLEAHAGKILTMSLAGTRAAYSPGEWDVKNVEEQQMVTDFIVESLKENGLNPSIGETLTKYAGPVEHICTPITAPLSSDFDNEKVNALLRSLSPTPAVCGLPRDFALQLIERYEHFNRGCYGGFCGPYHAANDFHLFVNLRSAMIEDVRSCIYVGGGITHLSNPDEEWEETAIKAQTISKFIEFQ